MRCAWALFLLTRVAVLAVTCAYHDASGWGWLPYPGGANVGIYAYFADVVARGADPYRVIGGPIDPAYADYPPIWVALFGALASVMNARTAVLLVCYAGDVALFAVAVAHARKRGGLDRWATLGLVLANPLWISNELVEAQYKTWLAAGLSSLPLTASPVVLGALSGAFVLPAALIPLQRLTKRAVATCAIAAICWLPFLATAWDAVLFRRVGRLALDAHRESLLLVGRPYAYAIGTALLVALMLSRGDALLRGVAALAVLTNLAPDAVSNRVLPFSLAVLIATPTTARARLLSLCACYVAAYAQTAGLGAAVHLPTLSAVWVVCRQITQAEAESLRRTKSSVTDGQ